MRYHVAVDTKMRPVGISILALVTALVGLLDLFLAGSVLLQAGTLAPAITGARALLLGYGAAYLLLALALWRLHSWTPWLAIGLLLAALIGGLLTTSIAERMDLGFVLVFVLAVAVNTAILMALFLPANRDLFRAGS